MLSIKRWMTGILLVLAVFSLTACGGEVEATKTEPAQVEPIADSDFSRVTLTSQAFTRLDIQTQPLTEESVNGETHMVVPYEAILYGLNGETWAYMQVDDLTFERTPLTVDRVEDGWAVLTDGPDLGTDIVTVGVSELYGTETGVGK